MNYGHGYTGDFVGSMSLDELQWHVNKRYEDLMEQKRLHEEAAKKAERKARSAVRKR